MFQGIKDILNKYSKLPYWIAAVEVGFLSLGIGLTSGWTSPYLAKLTKEGVPFLITVDEGSWIVALLSLGRILGAIIGAILAIIYGSKTTTFLAGIPLLIGWITLIVVKSVLLLNISRFITGICFGFFFVSFPLYIGEVSDRKIRGALVSLIMNCQPLGILLGNTMGAFLPMWLTSVICLIPNVIFLCSFLFLPNSPHYLVQKNQFKEAAKSIQWYHRDVDPVSELDQIKEFVKSKPSFKNVIKEFSKPKNRKALLIANILFAFMQSSGLYTITFYMEVILRDAHVNVMQPKTIVIIVNCIGLVAGWIGMFVIDKLGRRILLAISSTGIFLSLMLLTIDYSLFHHGFDAATIQSIPIVAIFIFQISICIGIMPVPCTILSEIFSPDIKEYAASITSITSGLFAFIASKTYQDFANIVPTEWVFFFYGVIMFIQIIYCFYIPETKGKSLQEIQAILEK